MSLECVEYVAQFLGSHRENRLMSRSLWLDNPELFARNVFNIASTGAIDEIR